MSKVYYINIFYKQNLKISTKLFPNYKTTSRIRNTRITKLLLHDNCIDAIFIRTYLDKKKHSSSHFLIARDADFFSVNIIIPSPVGFPRLSTRTLLDSTCKNYIYFFISVFLLHY